MKLKQQIFRNKTKPKPGEKTIIFILLILTFINRVFEFTTTANLGILLIMIVIAVIWFLFGIPKPIFCPSGDYNFNKDILRKSKEDIQDYNYCPKCSLDLNKEEKN